MTTEQGLYAQLVMLSRMDLKSVAVNKNKNEATFKLQGQYEISQSWFDLEFYWTEVNFSTSEPNLYKKTFQIHNGTQDTNTLKLFQVTIGNSKCVESFKFHNDAPILKYHQMSLNSYCYSSLASVFVVIKQIKTNNYI